jgi:hypothetical protein
MRPTSDLLNHSELLLRQIHPRYLDPETGQIQSLAFLPRPDDKGELSVDRSELCTLAHSFELFRLNFGVEPDGTVGFLVSECAEVGQQLSVALPVFQAPETQPRPNPAHAVVDFSGITQKTKCKRAAKMLRYRAHLRGWLHPPSWVNSTFPSD